MPTFSNQAQLSYNGITANSNIAYGQILEVLAASKTALSDTYTSGDRITYIFSIVNSGTTAFSDLTVTDNLGAYSFTTDTPETITLYPLTYIPNSMQLLINGTLQPAPTVTAADGITITGVSIPSGGNAAFIYQADINDTVAGGISVRKCCPCHRRSTGCTADSHTHNFNSHCT